MKKRHRERHYQAHDTKNEKQQKTNTNRSCNKEFDKLSADIHHFLKNLTTK